MKISSAAFLQGADIPVRHTCQGQDLSPALSWEDVPPGTASLALVCDDPDAPMGTWVHWVLYGLPGGCRSLPEGVAPGDAGPSGSRQGMTDFGRTGYGGPCPPAGTAHRYFFKLYALSEAPKLGDRASKDDLVKAMAGKILAEAAVMGRYKRR